MAHKIAEAIIWGLNKWCNLQEASNPPDASYLRDQEALGWDCFMDGWLMQSWYTSQETIWHSVWSCQSSWWWVAELIKNIWNVSWDMWANCNRIIHNSTQAKHEILEKKLNDQICKIYTTRTQELPQDTLVFIWKPKEHILQLPFTTKQQWLESVKVAMAWKQRHKYRWYLSEQQYMEMWVIHK